MHVVGVLIRALGVIADHDLRAVLLDQPADPLRHFGKRDIAERFRPVLVVPVGHAGVVVTERFQIGDAEDLAGLP